MKFGRAFWGFVVVLAALGAGAPVARASLSVPTGGPAVPFTGSGASVQAAVSGFEAAAGGGDNGTAAGERGGGFRHVTWDGIAADGSDPGSTVIKPAHVAAPARGRLQPWGLELGAEVAVANDGFASVNSNAGFAPFTRPNEWAPFNSFTAELQVVAPDGQGSTPVPAQTRGLGVVFLNVRDADTTEIQYYNGQILLGQVFAPVGATSFAGLLFPSPVVNRVVVTLGDAEIFGFNGTTATAGGNDITDNIVAGDDVVLAEPAPARPTVVATAGAPVSGVLDTFTETTPGANVRATIDWGDGTRTAGTIAPGAGGSFVVTGDHAYAQAGSYTAVVTVDDLLGPSQVTQTDIEVGTRPTATSVTCSPSTVAVSAVATCTATVTDLGPGGPSLPTGTVTFSSPTPGVTFAQDTGCVLGPSAVTGRAVCQVQFSPGRLPPRQARVDGHYSGDAAHASSDASATVAVRAQRCALHLLRKRQIRRTGRVAVIVTCDARTNVVITVTALASRTRSHAAVRFTFGTLRGVAPAGRPTVLVIKPAHGSLAMLRAVGRGRPVRLRLTLIASSRVTQATTTTRVAAAVRFG